MTDFGKRLFNGLRDRADKVGEEKAYAEFRDFLIEEDPDMVCRRMGLNGIETLLLKLNYQVFNTNPDPLGTPSYEQSDKLKDFAEKLIECLEEE